MTIDHRLLIVCGNRECLLQSIRRVMRIRHIHERLYLELRRVTVAVKDGWAIIRCALPIDPV